MFEFITIKNKKILLLLIINYNFLIIILYFQNFSLLYL